MSQITAQCWLLRNICIAIVLSCHAPWCLCKCSDAESISKASQTGPGVAYGEERQQTRAISMVILYLVELSASRHPLSIPNAYLVPVVLLGKHSYVDFTLFTTLDVWMLSWPFLSLRLLHLDANTLENHILTIPWLRNLPYCTTTHWQDRAKLHYGNVTFRLLQAIIKKLNLTMELLTSKQFLYSLALPYKQNLHIFAKLINI